MAESYWEQAARGAAPSMGMTSHVNPLAYSSPTTPFYAPQASQAAASPWNSHPAWVNPKSPVDLATDLRNQYKSAYDTARKDNLARYDQGIKMHDDLRERTMGTGSEYAPNDPRSWTAAAQTKKANGFTGYWDTFGDNQKKAIEQTVKQNVATTQAAATDRGIYNTSTALNQMGSANMEGQRLLADVEAKRAEGKLNTDARLTADKIGFVERRNDTYPDFNQLVALDKAVGSGSTEGMYGAYGGGGGGGDPFAAGRAVQNQYMQPQSGFVYNTPQKYQSTKEQDAMRKLSYEASRLGFKSVQAMLDARKAKGGPGPAPAAGSQVGLTNPWASPVGLTDPWASAATPSPDRYHPTSLRNQW